jgi:hypothetical protein
VLDADVYKPETRSSAADPLESIERRNRLNWNRPLILIWRRRPQDKRRRRQKSLEMLTWKWLVRLGLIVWLAGGLEKWRLASTLMCIKRGIHGGRSSDACARVSAVETHHYCDDSEAVVVMSFKQRVGMYTGARLYQILWYRDLTRKNEMQVRILTLF